MVHVEPVMVDREEIVTRELAIEVGALAEVAEIILGKWAHEGIFAVLKPRVGIVIGKVYTRMAVHHIDDDSDAVLVADVDESLEIRALAKPLVDPEVADRQIPPIYRTAHVRERHDLDGVDAEISRYAIRLRS